MSLVKSTNGNACSRPSGATPFGGVFDQLLGEVFPGAWRAAGTTARAAAPAFYPAVEITKGANEILLRAELPGIRKEDIEMTIHEDTLTLKGTKKYEKQEGSDGYSYSERSYGEFSRSFSLPKGLDAEKVKAEFKDGVLEVRLPLAEAAKPRKVDINVN